MSLPNIKIAAGSLYDQITSELSALSSKTYKVGGSEMKLDELDSWKNSTLPETLKARPEPFLTKDELTALMDWKLAKGKFRPTLPKLIRSNDDETVERVSKNAFAELLVYLESKPKIDWTADRKAYLATVKKALKIACELRGVGPATGSLMLSLLHKIRPEAPPFFSDESFLYYVVDANRPGSPIKYTAKEYCDEYVPVFVDIVDTHPDVTFRDLEKGAWALKYYSLNRDYSLTNIKPEGIDQDTLERYTEKKEKEKEEKKEKGKEKEKVKGEVTGETVKKEGKRKNSGEESSKRKRTKSADTVAK